MSNNYRASTAILLLGTVAALLVCAVSLTLKQEALPVQGSPEQNFKAYYSSSGGISQESGAADQPAEEPESQPETAYLVTVYRGKIGIFEAGASSPVQIADVEVYLLPEEDQRLLRQGIPAQNMAEVRRILEDYQ